MSRTNLRLTLTPAQFFTQNEKQNLCEIQNVPLPSFETFMQIETAIQKENKNTGFMWKIRKENQIWKNHMADCFSRLHYQLHLREKIV